MRTFTINGKSFEIRSIKRSERKEHNLEQYGWHGSAYSPPERKTDESPADYLARIEAGNETVLEMILGQDAINEIDALGGQKAVNEAWLEIVKETYGVRGEEKNSPPSGNGSQTESV